MRCDLPYPDALALVLASARSLRRECVALDRARGRRLAAPLASPLAVPPFAASAMDGVAVRRMDLPHVPIELPIAGASWAGAPFEGTIPPGAVVQIATGAVVPQGADAVVPAEWMERRGDHVVIQRAPAAGHAIRPAGSALREGAPLLPAGAPITPGAISVLASCGIHEIACVRRPRVQILVTGDEVVTGGTPLGPGQIYDANGPALAALVDAVGGRAELTRVGDDPGA
ncbi:MAG TPA: molybdopterin molybdenumtransferase MoeA, partial [Rhodothermales bacterium]|nr:molybdopterin molybdenumtransferase MoeA [Rhodothermales bacterium]